MVFIVPIIWQEHGCARGGCFMLVIFHETCIIVVGCMSYEDNGSQFFAEFLQDNIRIDEIG